MENSLVKLQSAKAVSRLAEAVKHFSRAKKDLKDKDFNLCILESQQTIEFSIKAALEILGVKPLKVHHPSMFLHQQINNKEFAAKLSDIIKLEGEYISSKYDEERGGKLVVPSLEFTLKECEEAVELAEWVFIFCWSLIREKLKKLPKSKKGLINYLKNNFGEVIAEK